MRIIHSPQVSHDHDLPGFPNKQKSQHHLIHTSACTLMPRSHFWLLRLLQALWLCVSSHDQVRPACCFLWVWNAFWFHFSSRVLWPKGRANSLFSSVAFAIFLPKIMVSFSFSLIFWSILQSYGLFFDHGLFFLPLKSGDCSPLFAPIFSCSTWSGPGSSFRTMTDPVLLRHPRGRDSLLIFLWNMSSNSISRSSTKDIIDLWSHWPAFHDSFFSPMFLVTLVYFSVYWQYSAHYQALINFTATQPAVLG